MIVRTQSPMTGSPHVSHLNTGGIDRQLRSLLDNDNLKPSMGIFLPVEE
jgi:hypothetical protein